MARPVKLEPPAAASPRDNGDNHVTERRLLRSRYLALKARIFDKREDAGKPDSDNFNSIINEVESLHKLVTKPREQVADAEALLDIANSLFNGVKAFSSDGITASDFVNCLLRDFGQHGEPGSSAEGGRRTIVWKDIGIAVSHIFGSCPGCRTMIGPMDTELKQRKAAAIRRTKPEERAYPSEINDSDGKQKTDTDKNMATMFNILKCKKSVKLENLILNRNSFAETVENLFTLSFLVKDGRAEINVNENGWHLVSSRNAPDASEITSGEVAYRHFIFRFDFKDWKLMTSFVGVGEELMPNRNPVDMLSVSPPGPVSVESQEARPTTPIRKLSRNRGLVLQEETITENSSPKSEVTQSRTAAIQKAKRKRR